MSAKTASEVLADLTTGYSDLAVKGKKMSYLAINGNMFAFASPENTLCLRFSEQQREILAAEFDTSAVIQYGSVMKGYVEIPQKVWDDASLMSDLFADCLSHAMQLKPKPTKR